ncbi:MAG: FGGY-family carbohydrate kinase, partial [Acidimicrobiales bacterium]
SWIVWHLSGGRAHVTDATNAGVSGLVGRNARAAGHAGGDGLAWDLDLARRLGIPAEAMPELVHSSGAVTDASALAGAPPVTAIVGDQQSSLVGQGCTQPGQAKITFGTGAMLDLCLGDQRAELSPRGPAGCYPIVAWSRGGRTCWGLEGLDLTAGAAVDWLVEDLGMLASAAESAAVAASCDDSGGVVVVPALLGLATPAWDFGARGAVLGFTRGSTRAQLVRAVLEGIAHRGADLVDAAESDSGLPITSLRVDGGMSANQVFVQALANACGRPVEVSPQLEATTLGAGLLAGLAVGAWGGEEDLARTWRPRAVVEPSAPAQRDRWRNAVERARRWYPELSALSF